MKKNIITAVCCFIICAAFTPISSNTFFLKSKIKFVLTDYRDVYVGTYVCKKYSRVLNWAAAKYSRDTSTVNVIVSKDNQDSIMQINLSGLILKAKLIGKGLQPYPIISNYGGNFFSTNGLDFYFTPNRAMTSRYLGAK